MRITVRPVADPGREVDLTDRLAATIAQELWLLYGGNDKLNWLEAERHLERIIGEARVVARGDGPEQAPPETHPRAGRRVRAPRACRAGGRRQAAAAMPTASR